MPGESMEIRVKREEWAREVANLIAEDEGLRPVLLAILTPLATQEMLSQEMLSHLAALDER